MSILCVFPRRTKATPDDDLVCGGDPPNDLFFTMPQEVKEIHDNTLSAQPPEVTTWTRLTPPDKREQRRRMWLYAPPKRCRCLIKALRWAWWNRVELLMLALCFFAVIGAEWMAKMLLQIGGM